MPPTPSVNVPPDAASHPFLVTPDPGAVDTAFENAGIVNMRVDRGPERDTPWAGGPTPAMLSKVTHFRAPGHGDPMWSGSCVYDLAGQSPSFSQYDQGDDLNGGSGPPRRQIRGGIRRSYDPIGVKEPTTTRDPRVSAQFDSAPAAAFFQGTFNTRWSGLFTGYFHPTPRPAMHQNFNPGQMGTKELHKATQYKPVPPMGSLVGYFGSSNDKAL